MLKPISPLGGHDVSHGTLRLWERADWAMVSLAIPLGGAAAAQKALKSAYKLEIPAVGASVCAPPRRLIRMTPDQAMLVWSHDEALAEPEVQQALNGTCYTTNQTDAWMALSIEGDAARDVLERLCPLDLHPDAFAIDRAERTVMEHMGAVILREATDRYTLMSASSSARSFLHAVETSIKYVL